MFWCRPKTNRKIVNTVRPKVEIILNSRLKLKDKNIVNYLLLSLFLSTELIHLPYGLTLNHLFACILTKNKQEPMHPTILCAK